MSGRENDFGHHRGGRARRAASGVLWSAVTALLPVLSGLVVFVLVSRVIGPAEFGWVALAVAVTGAIGALSPAGFGDALVQRDALEPRHLDATFWLCAVWGVVLYAATVALAAPLARAMGEPMLATLLPVVGVRLIFDHLAVVPAALLSRTMQFRKLALRTTFASVLSMAVCLVVLWRGHGVWALVLSQLAAAAVAAVVAWLAIAWRPRLSVPRDALRELADVGVYTSGTRLVAAVNVDQLVIGPLLGSAALGLFSFARRIFQMLNDLLTGVLAQVAFPLLSSMQSEPERLRQAFLSMTFLSSVVAFPCFVGLALIAPDLVPLLFGAQWAPAVPVLQAFCALGLVSCISTLQASLIRARGRADWWMWYQVAQQVSTAVLIVLLAPWGIGVVTAAIAAKVWATAPVVAAFSGRLIDLPPGRYLAQFVAPLAAVAMMAGAVLALQRYGSLDGATGLAAQVAGGALVYAVTILLLARRRLAAIVAMVRAR